VKAGEITADEADVHPHRNVLTRALGTEPEVQVDVSEVPLMGGDRALLCSDGLFGMVTEDQIQAILEVEPDPQKAAERLIRAANSAGGVDNITVVVLDAHDDGDESDAGAPARAPSALSGPEGRRSMKRWGIGLGLGLLVLVGAFFTGRGYVDAQWYVGVANGHVAIYRGIPATPLGYHLSHVEEQTDLLAADVQELEIYASLPDGINASSREDAQAVVDQMRKDLQASQPQKGVGGP
jgi:PPM family protein phosphatase